MCSSNSKSKLHKGNSNISSTVSHINGRAVLQPKSNQVPNLERRVSLKKVSPKSPPPLAPLPSPKSTTIINKASSLSPPISPKLKSPRPPAVKRGNDPNELTSSTEKVTTPRSVLKLASSVKKSKKANGPIGGVFDKSNSFKHNSSLLVEAPGSIAAARREQVATMQEQRKSKIAHYGRTKSAKFEGKVGNFESSAVNSSTGTSKEKKRCSFITPNSDPIYVAYHDEEWGVPVHDDKMLFELLVLTSAQVGSDWTSLLKKRQIFREAFSEFDPEIVAKFSEKKITTTSSNYVIDIGLVRGAVDNSKRILEVRKEFGSFEKYMWEFVNHKAISTEYKSTQKIPVKTSKSESISKDMVKRGFRSVGPTVIYSFMEAVGLTNDHLITCPRHHQCNIALAN
ncbi:hypothetical protein ACFE04_029489 [Oxalis oulophora]